MCVQLSIMLNGYSSAYYASFENASPALSVESHSMTQSISGTTGRNTIPLDLDANLTNQPRSCRTSTSNGCEPTGREALTAANTRLTHYVVASRQCFVTDSS